MDKFPFGLEDIQGWLIRRRDGVSIRYTLISAETAKKMSEPVRQKQITGSTKTSYSDWCPIHQPTPADDPIFEKDGVRIYVADYIGGPKNAGMFDVAVDCGNILTIPGYHDLPLLYGDPGLSKRLSRHVDKPDNTGSYPHTKILKIRWADREAPPVYVQFWPALLEEIKKMQDKKGTSINVVTICHGGHGRSGTSASALIMCLSDYTPLDVLTHIRAVHCARAIESKVQHEYLNAVGEMLGREQNALEAVNVKSFRERFLGDERFDSIYRDRVREKGVAGVRASMF